MYNSIKTQQERAEIANLQPYNHFRNIGAIGRPRTDYQDLGRIPYSTYRVLIMSKIDAEKADPAKTESEKTESEKTESAKAESEKAESEKPISRIKMVMSNNRLSGILTPWLQNPPLIKSEFIIDQKKHDQMENIMMAELFTLGYSPTYEKYQSWTYCEIHGIENRFHGGNTNYAHCAHMCFMCAKAINRNSPNFEKQLKQYGFKK